jgi:hypothetical protein
MRVAAGPCATIAASAAVVASNHQLRPSFRVKNSGRDAPLKGVDSSVKYAGFIHEYP